MTRSDGRPAWMAQVQAWVNATLDEEDARFHQNLANNAATMQRLRVQYPDSRLDDDEKARRKIAALRKTQEWLEELAIRQADEQGNIEPLQKQNPRLARFIKLPRRGRGKRFERPLHPASDRLDQAVAELPRVRELLNLFHENKAGYPRGRLTAAQILAERWDLTENEIRKRRILRSRRQANFVRPK
jgi:DNA anti-recombination protein RmuC